MALLPLAVRLALALADVHQLTWHRIKFTFTTANLQWIVGYISHGFMVTFCSSLKSIIHFKQRFARFCSGWL
jgi:hypothetical protein